MIIFSNLITSGWRLKKAEDSLHLSLPFTVEFVDESGVESVVEMAERLKGLGFCRFAMIPRYLLKTRDSPYSSSSETRKSISSALVPSRTLHFFPRIRSLTLARKM